MKNLYLIGNGFDLHHNRKSSYWDFMVWLKESREFVYDKIVQYYGKDAEKDMWWSSFEESLGYPDCISEYADNLGFLNKPTSEDFERDRVIDDRRARYDAEEELGELINAIEKSFHDWIKQLPPPNPDAKISIDTTDSLFINFNYSLTLQELYGITNVLHIHGRVEENEEEHFVIGHCRTVKDFKEEMLNQTTPEYDGSMDPSEYLASMYVDTITEQARDATCEVYASLRKDVDTIIENNKEVFDSMSSVENVFIYGMSFGKVDEKYFDKVFDSVPKTAKIVVSCYDERAKAKVDDYMAQKGLKYTPTKLTEILEYRQNTLFG